MKFTNLFVLATAVVSASAGTIGHGTVRAKNIGSAIAILVEKSCDAIPKCKAGREDFIAWLAKKADEAPNPQDVIADAFKEVSAQPGFLETLGSVLANIQGGIM
ncbi:hypothetical protein TWF696_007762 [Orbilia brochopaga]|uniref:Uncharacterized protein n=1 Tax=Orbilia brochopaga TaxID=3140254 RepID=A0AAV9UNG4_9PEZI